jgi:hypothetical protein
MIKGISIGQTVEVHVNGKHYATFERDAKRGVLLTRKVYKAGTDTVLQEIACGMSVMKAKNFLLSAQKGNTDKNVRIIVH